jgi:hypothetical protein
MKAILLGAAALAALIGVVSYEEGRISGLEKELAALKKETPKSSPGTSERRFASVGSVSGGGGTGKSERPRTAGIERTSPEGGTVKEGDWSETFRKMMENPVGAAMIKEESKGKALRIYGNFLDSLHLDKKEKEYFLGLVAGGVGEEDTVGMKLFGAKSDEERVKILNQMEADQEARKAAIEEFLNNDEDFARYEHFEERKEIYEQMPGLRAAMNDTGAPMSDAQEEGIVEAIYQASVQSGLAEQWDGRAGMEQFTRPGATQRFKDGWGAMQNILNENIGTVLENPVQQAALREQQTQMGNMAVFGLQFVEGMIAGQQGGGGE